MKPGVLLMLFVMVACTSRHQEADQQRKDTDSSSQPQLPIRRAEYVLVKQDGIYVEEFDSTQKDKNCYNQNNNIFQVGSSFTYLYDYTDTSGKTFYTKSTSDGWEFIPTNQADKQTNKHIIIRVMPDRMDALYNQTILSYHYPPHLNFSMSGVIENEKNVSMHPPRDGLFRILELNPFPFIQAPYQTGNQ